VTLAENGGDTDWIEGDREVPARNYADAREGDDALVTVTAWIDGGLVRLDVYAPLNPPAGSDPRPAPLTAVLSRTLVSGAVMEVATVPGSCTEVNG